MEHKGAFPNVFAGLVHRQTLPARGRESCGGNAEITLGVLEV
jgi:hypothetical protein